MPSQAPDEVPKSARLWLLAIDTSSDQAGVALYDGERLRLHEWPCVRAQTTQVPPVIQRLLDDAGLEVADLAAVAVATGPGTFTGLRVGMSLAKGFALGGPLPIVGVPTPEAAAAPWVRAGLSVVAVVPAGRGRLVWQAVASHPSHVPVNSTPAELVAWTQDNSVDLVIGEVPPSLRPELDALPVPLITGPLASSRVAAVATIAHERLLRGEQDDLATLEPVYVHGTRAAQQAVRDPQP